MVGEKQFEEAEPEVTVIHESRKQDDGSWVAGGMSGGGDAGPPADTGGGGGMSASSDGAPYSTAGTAPDASSASEPPPPLDMSDVVFTTSDVVDAAGFVVETGLSALDVAGAFAGEMTGLQMVKPQRMLGPDEVDPDGS